MLRGLLLMSLVRGLALAALPLCVLQPFPDRGLFLRRGSACLILGFLQFLPTAAVVDDPVNHPIVVLQCHFSGAERVLRLHRQGDDLTVQVDELLRLLEVLHVLLRQFRGDR